MRRFEVHAVGGRLGAAGGAERVAPRKACCALDRAARLAELNERLSLQTLEIADQAAEVQRQRDAFEATARELADKRAWLETVLTQLPVGMMLVGRPAGDAALLTLAAQVEAAAPRGVTDDRTSSERRRAPIVTDGSIR